MKVFDSYEVADAMADLLNNMMRPGVVAFVKRYADGWVISMHDQDRALLGNVGDINDVAETIREYMK